MSGYVNALWHGHDGDALPAWASPSFTENAAGFFGGGFDPWVFAGPRTKKVAPVRSTTLADGSFELLGQPPHFPPTFTARFHRRQPATFSAQSRGNREWELAVARARYQADI